MAYRQYYAAIVILIFVRPGLSADDRQIAVQNTAFEAVYAENPVFLSF